MLPLLLACTGSDPATTDTDDTDTSPPEETSPTDTDEPTDTDDTAPADDTGKKKDPPRPIVVLMIGDGMGSGQRNTASLYAHGQTGQLFLEQLPYSSQVITASLSGVTDSAASATAMASGSVTWNGVVGLDDASQEVQSLVELAHSLGLSAGVVTTAEVTHATPAAFTAHHQSRNDGPQIADDQVALLPEVLMGGGAAHYLPKGEGSERTDGGLVEPLQDAGCSVIFDAASLAADDGSAPCLFGLFASSHLSYMIDRPAETTEPTLSEMTAAALERLDADEDGFFLMVEGARIDMGGHSNNIEQVIGEMIEFDATVALVSEWLEGREQALLVVTADHETGGLDIVEAGGKGEISTVSWRHREHTNADITLYASGDGAEQLDGRSLHHPDVHAILSAHLREGEVVEPALPLIPDGSLSDHRWRVSEQALVTDFGEGFNQLDAMTLDVSSHGLFIGIEGLFEWENNAVMLLVDHDPGQGTGITSLSGSIADTDGSLDAILSSAEITTPEGFGADLAVMTLGGNFSQAFGSPSDKAGVRGISEDFGAPKDLWWMDAGINFADDVRIRDTPGSTISDHGVEVFVPWDSLYPEQSLPVGAAISVAAVLVNSSGTALSNQALPPHAEAPDTSAITLPGMVYFQLDSDKDGAADGDVAPVLLP